MKKVIVFLALALPAFSQFGNATRIQTVPVKAPLSCSDGYVITYVAANSRFECLAGGAGSSAFSSVTAGTNTAALVMGTGGSLTVSGSGTINATSLGGNLAATYAPLASPSFTGIFTLGTSLLTATGTSRFPGHNAMGNAATINQNTPFGQPASVALGVHETVTDLSVAGIQYSGVRNWADINLSGPPDVGAGISFDFNYLLKSDSETIVNNVYANLNTFELSGGGAVGLAYGSSSGVLNDAGANITAGYGIQAYVENDGAGTITDAYGVSAAPAQNYGVGTITRAYGMYVDSPANSGGGTVGLNAAFYSKAQANANIPNSYDFWADEQGVFRIKADNTFDSVYQAIPALYNPQFTKYTPGASNYERIVEQWNGNVAEFGTQNGGTGTLRALRFLGPSVEAVSYKTATNCSNAASPAVCGSAAAGAVAIPTGVTSVTLVVNTTAVTANSRITLTSDDSLTIAATTCNSTLATLVGGLAVTARSAGTSFTITYNGTIATNPLCVSYTIEN